MKIFFWAIALVGTGYSFWYAYYLIKDRNKLGAFGIAFVGLLISGLAYFVRMK
jgi:hypothetical protein